MIYLSETLLYVCFALLMGAFTLRLVPEGKRPQVIVPDRLLLACALAIPVLSFVPLDQTARTFAADFELSYGQMMKSLLLDAVAGKALIWTLLSSLGLSILLGMKSFRQDRHMPKVGLFITLLLAVWLGYASHASSLYGLKGIVIHSAHFIAVTIWLGIVITTSWFSKDENHWEAFLSWFSTLAFGCFFVTISAGITLMTFTTPEYVNAWMLPYGQMLLIKHLLLLPLLLLAYSNSFGYKNKLKHNAAFRPLLWFKAESIVALLIFIATSVLGQQAPPHEVKETLQITAPSSLFTTIYKGSFSPDITLHFSLGLDSLLLLASAVVMIVGFFRMYRSEQLMPAFAMGLLAAAFGYGALMFAIA
ncbi:CopD family protein [Paenibacillus algorifonticola]|uniref:copper resistance D family protein n=1 Tax=Paenibacillus algorifonticola TaxID=684063 RepID=UPI003D29A7D3